MTDKRGKERQKERGSGPRKDFNRGRKTDGDGEMGWTKGRQSKQASKWLINPKTHCVLTSRKIYELEHTQCPQTSLTATTTLPTTPARIEDNEQYLYVSVELNR